MDSPFDQARQLFQEGIAHFEAGRLEQAEAKFLASLALTPGRPSILSNLAATRLALGRPADALPLLEQVLHQAPDDARARLQLGMALSALAQHAQALAHFQRCSTAAPQLAAAWLWQGHALRHLERHDEALPCYDKAIELDPQMGPAWAARGAILSDRKELVQAAQAFEQAIAHGADPEVNGFMLASLRGETPSRVPRPYVQGLFDEYAQTFDDHLVGVLNYQAHSTLIETLRSLHGLRFSSALDLGCGTGLCAPLLSAFVDHIDGVDVAGLMLDKARERGLYENLDHADLAEHLHATERRYQLVLAADVFPYVGDLAEVFGGVRRVLASGGWFCFSVEAALGSEELVLGTSQRYTHSEPYLREHARANGFEVAGVFKGPIREDQRRPIAGLYIYLKLTPFH